MIGAGFWQLVRLPALFTRRRRFQATRQVSDAEVASLQGVRGSARLGSSAASAPPIGKAEETVSPSSAATCASSSAGRTRVANVVVWRSCWFVLVVGSRELILNSVPQAGELLAWPAGPVVLAREYAGRLVVPGSRRDPASPDGDGPVRRPGFAHPRRQRPSPHAARRGPALRRRVRAVAFRPRHRAEPGCGGRPGRVRRGAAGRQRRRHRARSPAFSSMPRLPWTLHALARIHAATPFVTPADPRPGPAPAAAADVVVLGVIAAIVGAFVPVYPAVMVARRAGLRRRVARRGGAGGQRADGARQHRRRAHGRRAQPALAARRAALGHAPLGEPGRARPRAARARPPRRSPPSTSGPTVWRRWPSG